jgi:GT2 family glycosyltransferase
VKVSIILTYPPFEPPLPKCILSIKNQTYKDVEIISGTEKDFGFTEKKGLGFMRTFLAKKATGEILIFFDTDATMFPNFIEVIVNLFTTKDIDIISGLPCAPPRKETDFLNLLLGVDYESRILQIQEGYVSVAAGTCMCVKKDVFFDIGGFITTQTFGEDWYFSSEAIQKGYKIWHTNKARIYHYTGENLVKYLKKQYKYAHYRIFHAKKFKRMKDEYVLLNFNLSKLRIYEKLFYLLLVVTRGFIWIAGAVFGVIKFHLLKQSINESKFN